MPLAQLIPDVTRLVTLDAPWLAREAASERWPALIGRARGWRARRYDLAINFEPDIRSNLLLWLTGARRRFGYWTGGGGAFLTDALAYEPRDARRRRTRGGWSRGRAAGRRRRRCRRRRPRRPRLAAPPDADRAGGRARSAGAARPLVGVHASGGRESKQWHLDRFAAGRPAACRVARRDDRADRHRRAIGRSSMPSRSRPGRRPVIDASGAARPDRRSPRCSRGSTCSSPATPARCTWPPRWARPSSRSSARRLRGATGRWPRGNGSCASTCRAARAARSGCRPSVAAGHVPDCMDGIQVETVVAPPPPNCWTQAEASGRLRSADERRRPSPATRAQGHEIHTDLASLLTAGPARSGARRSQPLDQAPSSRALRRSDDARALHVSRRLAVVVHRALPAQDAQARPRRVGDAGARGGPRAARRRAARGRDADLVDARRRPRLRPRARRAGRDARPRDRTRGDTRWPSYLVGLYGRRSRACARRCRRRVRRRRSSPPSCTPRSGAPAPSGDGPQQESYIGAVLDAVAARLRRRRSVLRRRRPAPQLPRAALVGSASSASSAVHALVTPIERLAPRERLAAQPRRSGGSASTLADERHGGRRHPRRRRVPRLRSLAGPAARARGGGAAAVAVVGARDGRSRRRARRAGAATSC